MAIGSCKNARVVFLTTKLTFHVKIPSCLNFIVATSTSTLSSNKPDTTVKSSFAKCFIYLELYANQILQFHMEIRSVTVD